jgi:iron(III) transport system ATP-binding protein
MQTFGATAVADIPQVRTRTESAQGRRAQVRVSHLSKTFERRRESIPVLKDINFEIGQGELLVLLGASGCGKTTLLRCLVGLEKPDVGQIRLGDRDVVDSRSGLFVQPNRRDVAMVFQNYALWPHMKVTENVAYPLKARGMKGEIAKGRVQEVLKIVQCEHLAERSPAELSGGQQQRVSLARALAPRPSLLLLDEPLSNLDAVLRIELQTQLRRLHREIGFTGVYVTHDQEEAMALGTRVVVMKDGRFEQVGTPDEVYEFPATEYVADFLGARNRFELLATGDGNGVVEGTVLEGFLRQGLKGNYVLRLRDENLTIRALGASTPLQRRHWVGGATLIEVLPAGGHNEHVVQLGDRYIFIDVPAELGRLERGSNVEIGIDPFRTLCYGHDEKLVYDWTPIQ